MTDMLAALQASLDKARSFTRDLSSELDKSGGFLRCEECGARKTIKPHDASFYVVKGWPRHCGYTMRWWTQRQIDAGEVPHIDRFIRDDATSTEVTSASTFEVGETDD